MCAADSYPIALGRAACGGQTSGGREEGQQDGQGDRKNERINPKGGLLLARSDWTPEVGAARSLA
jgi:hypothetical protein